MGRFRVLGALLLLSATSVMGQGVIRAVPDDAPSQIQFSAGMSFTRFNELPGINTNNFGIYGSVLDYRDNLGFEAQVSEEFGSQAGQTTQVFFVGGGPRFRWANARPIQPWVHALVGYDRFSPHTAYGYNSSLGDKVGGGVDFIPHSGRIRFRVSVDMFNTNFFRTYQVSPEVTGSVVFNLNRWGNGGH
jgi:hypothetical protein